MPICLEDDLIRQLGITFRASWELGMEQLAENKAVEMFNRVFSLLTIRPNTKKASTKNEIKFITHK